ncbi:[citrate (pro-3S)-lyase] ligase, partial [Salmonella enterica subsp. enterica serovar Infantis]
DPKRSGPVIEVVELARVEQNGTAISAYRVRQLYSERNWPAISALVPAVTLAYLQLHAAIHTETR